MIMAIPAKMKLFATKVLLLHSGLHDVTQMNGARGFSNLKKQNMVLRKMIYAAKVTS